VRVLLADLPTISMEAPLVNPLGDRHDVVRCNALDPGEFAAAIADADAVVLEFTGVPKEALERACRLRLIQKIGAGYDRIDVAAATARGIPVAVTPGANAIVVAEHAFALMLTLARDFDGQRARLARGEWHDYLRLVHTVELFEATLGIVGLGAIGVEIARRAAAFGMRPIACSRSPKPELEGELGIERVALPDLLRQSDFVVLACPLTPETRGLIDAAALARMKPSAYLINIARGAVIDEPALIDALRSGRIAGAGLDVFATEPVPPDNPLLSLPNVVATPHVAGLSVGAQRRIWRMIADNLDRVERGESPRRVVNPEVLTKGSA
jgi:phosphoglycerate dehydrogenase-like enzyme